MNIENPLWGAPRIHGELLKLGFEVAQSSVAKYMVKRSLLPRDGKTFRASGVVSPLCFVAIIKRQIQRSPASGD